MTEFRFVVTDQKSAPSDNCIKRKDFFYSHYVFKGAKLAKFIRFEAVGKLMWDEVRDASISITKFTEIG